MAAEAAIGGPAPLGILGDAFQVCYVTADRAAGTAAVAGALGLGAWTELEAEIEIDPQHGGGTASVAVGFARWGRFVIEVLEPRAGAVEVFRRGLAADGSPRLHHVGIRVADLAAARRQAAAAGAPCALAGGLAGHLSFAFVDAGQLLGHHLELVEFAPGGWDLMAGILGEPG